MWKSRRYLAVALDPVHVGAGGERLGRVDMPVAREPVTGVPKIPGTALSGALKYFADRALRDAGVKTSTCASTSGSDKGNPHRHQTCPVCAAFGFTAEDDQARGEEAGLSAGSLSMKGMLQFSDALLTAVPAMSYLGPVWASTQERLCEALGIQSSGLDSGDEAALPSGSGLSEHVIDGALNLGWLALGVADQQCSPSIDDMTRAGYPSSLADRTVFVSETLFISLSNDSLEQRTSVVINPETGAAQGKGLFTFEAVPRGSVFSMEITLNDYFDGWPSVEWGGDTEKPSCPLGMIEESSFPGVEAIGLGGMTTRGFGRMRISPVCDLLPTEVE